MYRWLLLGLSYGLAEVPGDWDVLVLHVLQVVVRGGYSLFGWLGNAM